MCPARHRNERCKKKKKNPSSNTVYYFLAVGHASRTTVVSAAGEQCAARGAEGILTRHISYEPKTRMDLMFHVARLQQAPHTCPQHRTTACALNKISIAPSRWKYESAAWDLEPSDTKATKTGLQCPQFDSRSVVLSELWWSVAKHIDRLRIMCAIAYDTHPTSALTFPVNSSLFLRTAHHQSWHRGRNWTTLCVFACVV